MREFWALNLPNGEVSGARAFGCSGCDGSSAGGGAEEEIKFLGIRGMICLLGGGARCTCVACSAGGVSVPACCCHHVLQQTLRPGFALLSPVWGRTRPGYRILLGRHLYNNVHGF